MRDDSQRRDPQGRVPQGSEFVKGIGLGKGVRINKDGISIVSFSKHGTPHVTVGKWETYVGVSISGTGISYSHKISGSGHATPKLGTVITPDGKTSSYKSATRNQSESRRRSEVSSEYVSPDVSEYSASAVSSGSSASGSHSHALERANKQKKKMRSFIIVAIVALLIGNCSDSLTQST